MTLKITFDGKVAGQAVKPSAKLKLSDGDVTIKIGGKEVKIPARTLAEQFIGLIDRTDAQPNDGEVDIKVAFGLGWLPREWGASGILTLELVD